MMKKTKAMGVFHNMDERIEDTGRLARILYTSRYEAKKSQEYMAMGLGVSKNTIYNFEKGTSQPSVLQFYYWFKLLGLNPTPYIFQFFNPEALEDVSSEDNDQTLANALHTLIDTLPPREIRQLLYLLYGSHGSNPSSVLQMITANLHCPMRDRVNVARTIVDNYDIAEQRGELLEVNHVMPDMEDLRKAVESGKSAAIKGHAGY